jgi:hypothetical protein
MLLIFVIYLVMQPACMLLILHLTDLPADAVNFCDLFSHVASLIRTVKISSAMMLILVIFVACL